jgi:hypothetical protein
MPVPVRFAVVVSVAAFLVAACSGGTVAPPAPSAPAPGSVPGSTQNSPPENAPATTEPARVEVPADLANARDLPLGVPELGPVVARFPSRVDDLTDAEATAATVLLVFGTTACEQKPAPGCGVTWALTEFGEVLGVSGELTAEAFLDDDELGRIVQVLGVPVMERGSPPRCEGLEWFIVRRNVAVETFRSCQVAFDESSPLVEVVGSLAGRFPPS